MFMVSLGQIFMVSRPAVGESGRCAAGMFMTTRVDFHGESDMLLVSQVSAQLVRGKLTRIARIATEALIVIDVLW